jgi:hypothetical protein
MGVATIIPPPQAPFLVNEHCGWMAKFNNTMVVVIVV